MNAMQKLTFYIQTLLLFICKKNHVNKRAKWLKQEKKLAFVLWQGHLQALCSFQAWSQILQLESNLPGNCASVIIGLFSFSPKILRGVDLVTMYLQHCRGEGVRCCLFFQQQFHNSNAPCLPQEFVLPPRNCEKCANQLVRLTKVVCFALCLEVHIFMYPMSRTQQFVNY